jgi:catechol 2,3-dioxygenase-like lactoylglutathione lyase family enzyme
MPRGIVDYAGLKSSASQALRDLAPKAGLPFRLTKIGHVVLMSADLPRSVAFYTGVLGFRVSDVYPETMMKGRMVFMRCAADHHGVALVGAAPGASPQHELHHMAFEVSTLDEVFHARAWLRKQGVKIEFEGRRRAGCQVAVEFRDPDGHWLEIYWGLDQVGADGKIRPPEEWRECFTLEDAVADAPPGQDTTRRPDTPALRR